MQHRIDKHAHTQKPQMQMVSLYLVSFRCFFSSPVIYYCDVLNYVVFLFLYFFSVLVWVFFFFSIRCASNSISVLSLSTILLCGSWQRANRGFMVIYCPKKHNWEFTKNVRDSATLLDFNMKEITRLRNGISDSLNVLISWS